MKMERYLPAPALRPFIKTFMIIECDESRTNYVVPDTGIVMAFRYKGKVSWLADGDKGIFPAAALTGLRKTHRSIFYDDNTANLLVVFRENGAAAFFREPMNEVFGSNVSLEQLIPLHKLETVIARLEEADNNETRVSIMENFLLKEKREFQPDTLIEHAIMQIQNAGGDLRMKALLKELHISQDPFEKRFRRIVGATPKQFSTITRLRNIINQPATSFTEKAYAAGYFDQAHFIKDFKAFTGKTPGEFFLSPNFW